MSLTARTYHKILRIARTIADMRKAYHNRHSEGKWGDSRLYDLCMNSSTLGMEKTVEVLEQYLQKRYE